MKSKLTGRKRAKAGVLCTGQVDCLLRRSRLIFRRLRVSASSTSEHGGVWGGTYGFGVSLKKAEKKKMSI